MPVSTHDRQHRGIGVFHVDQDITLIGLLDLAELTGCRFLPGPFHGGYFDHGGQYDYGSQLVASTLIREAHASGHHAVLAGILNKDNIERA